MQKITITYDREEELSTRFEEMEYKCGDWLPALDDIDYYFKHVKVKKRFCEFLMWILATYTGNDTEGFKSVRKKINSILYQNLEFVE